MTTLPAPASSLNLDRHGWPRPTAAERRQNRLDDLADGYKFERDGWAVQCVLGRTDGGPGLRGGEPELLDIGEPWVIDREEWDACFPGVEPTAEVLAAQVALHTDEMLDEAVDDAGEV